MEFRGSYNSNSNMNGCYLGDRVRKGNLFGGGSNFGHGSDMWSGAEGGSSFIGEVILYIGCKRIDFNLHFSFDANTVK